MSGHVIFSVTLSVLMYMVKTPFKVSLESSGFEHKTEENLKCLKFNIELMIWDHIS